MLESKFLFKEVCKAVACYTVRDDCASWERRSKNCREEGDDAVAVYFCSVAEYGAHAVNICIKNKSKVSLAACCCILDCLHCILVFWVWNMVREHSVWLKESASCCVCTERLKNLVYEEPAISVACINYDMET